MKEVRNQATQTSPDEVLIMRAFDETDSCQQVNHMYPRVQGTDQYGRKVARLVLEYQIGED